MMSYACVFVGDNIVGHNDIPVVSVLRPDSQNVMYFDY